MSRKEKRKLLKKLKRVQVRRQVASQRPDGEEEDGNSADENGGGEPAADDEQDRLWRQRDEEAHQEWLRKQKEEADRKLKQEQQRKELEEADVLEEGWEYVEDGPAEITWIGNEIIVKKARRKVRKGIETGTPDLEDKHKPYSNPLPPQSTAFSTHHLNTLPAPEEPVNFGTEQDKRNCPFYIKTGVCRYGVRCSRIHPFVRDKACTLLMQSMYCGAGLSSESSDSLEYTEEEVEQEFEEFYEDVHSEFLQFGELVNFKVCRNGSHHMRGNVYVHFLSPESAVAAYNAINGRFYAKKQITCEFVGITKWRSAICGEYMQANHKGCSHGSACNFMHCFENPRREYEWADWDRPPPRYWKDKMGKLFGYPSNLDKDYDRQQRRERHHRDSTPDQGDQRRDRDRMYNDERRRRDSRRAGNGDGYRRERDSGKYVRRDQQWKESPYDNNAHSSGRDHYSHDDGGGPSERSRSHRHGDHSGSRSKSGDVHMDKRPRREDRLVSLRELDQERHDSTSEELGGQSPGRHRDKSRSRDVHRDERSTREKKVVSSRKLEQERNDGSGEELGEQNPGRHWDRSRSRDAHKDRRSRRDKKAVSSRKLEQERNDSSTEELGEQSPEYKRDRSEGRAHHKDRRSRRSKKTISSGALERERNGSSSEDLGEPSSERDRDKSRSQGIHKDSTEELGEQSPEYQRDRSEGRAHHKDRRSRRSKKMISSGALERERNGSSSEDLGEPSSERHRDKSRSQGNHKDRRSTREKKLDSPRSVKPERSARSSEELAEQSPEKDRDSERRKSFPDENYKGPQ